MLTAMITNLWHTQNNHTQNMIP